VRGAWVSCANEDGALEANEVEVNDDDCNGGSCVDKF
jgi:hypothetical protein